MRSLDECRAEIFARSEKRIENRRKIRRRIGAGMVPLCLCIALLAILPKISLYKNCESMKKSAGNAECAGVAADGAIKIETQQSGATVTAEDGTSWTLSEKRTSQLKQILNRCFYQENDSAVMTEYEFKIEIPDSVGNGILFFLSGNLLSYEGNTFELNYSSLQQIMDLLQPETP